MDLAGRFIVIIERDLHITELICAVLEKHGAKVYCGSWTDDMLAFIIQNKYEVDAILMNMRHIHNKTGFDVLHELQTQLTYPYIPVIAVSGTDKYDAPHISEAGFAGFIHKPIKFKQLLDQLSRILEQPANAAL